MAQLSSSSRPIVQKIQELSFFRTKIAESRHQVSTEEHADDAESLNIRDKKEEENPFGQNVSETFPLADVFIDVSEPAQLRESIDRILRILFEDPYETPTKDELVMFHARAAALRSASLSRQVGAVIATEEGDVIAVGCNEVPKAGGGLYWTGDVPDRRDHWLGYDPSDRKIHAVLGDILRRDKEDIAKYIEDEKDAIFSAIDDVDMKEKILNRVKSALKETADSEVKRSHVMNLIEFGRAVHAEMAALMDAARRGVSVKGRTLYSTTFPCHGCAKHIVAAGIQRVIYIEPYPKSLAPELYPDSIQVDAPVAENFVSFQPFVGIAPRLFGDIFEAPKRKFRREDLREGKEGKIGDTIKWKKENAILRLRGSPPSYKLSETDSLKSLQKVLEEKGLKIPEFNGKEEDST